MSSLKHAILVNIDSVLDTRLATFGARCPEQASELLLSRKWHNRRHNRINELDPKVKCPDETETDQWFKDRDTDMVRQAMPTEILPMLADLVERYRTLKGTQSEVMTIELHLNVYPYSFKREERQLMVETLNQSVGADKTHSCRLPVEALTPQYLSQFNSVIYHDFNEWMLHHHKELETKAMEGVQFYAPEVIHEREVPLDQIPEGAAAHEAMLIYSPYVSFQIMPMHYFSISQIMPTAYSDSGS